MGLGSLGGLNLRIRLQAKLSSDNRVASESELTLLAARQAGIAGDESLGQGIETLFGKPADREGGGLLSQRTIFPMLEFRLLLY